MAKKTFNEAEKIAERIGGHIPERVIIDETHELKTPGKIIIGPQQKTEVIITMSLEEYIELKEKNTFLKGKEETVEERVKLARDAGYYQGRSSVFEEFLKTEEEEEDQNTIDILDISVERSRYREELIESLNKEILRIRALKLKSQPDKRKEGIIEGLEKAKEIILKEN